VFRNGKKIPGPLTFDVSSRHTPDRNNCHRAV
jgi:hypothetical protein